MSTLSYELGYLARQQLAVILDHESPQGRDWMGLADKMQFTYSTVLALKGARSPTLVLLEEWEKAAGLKATVATLISLLNSLQCKEAVNILEEEKILSKKYVEDGNRAKRRDKIEIKHARVFDEDPISISIHCLKLADSDSDSPSPEKKERLNRVAVDSSSHTNNSHDSLEVSISHVRSQKYDVFLSYAEEDREFAEEMRRRLITHAKLRVFVPSDGLPPGKVFHEEIADMIKKGCRKTVVILSPDYVRSPWCNYEANLAMVVSPDASRHVLIPVLYRRCEIPAFLSALYYSDYPRHQANKEECERYFWQKLYKSLTYVPRTH